MQDIAPRTGTVPEPAVGTETPSLNIPLPGLPSSFLATKFLDGTEPSVTGEAMYAAALQDAGAVWQLYLDDSLQAPSCAAQWGADLETSTRRLRKFGFIRKSAWLLDTLLKPISALLPCASPFQRRLLRTTLDRSFQDTSKFALMRDLGRAYHSGATAQMAPLRRAMPGVLSEAQFGRDPITPEDHRRAFRSLEDFTLFVSRWIPAEGGVAIAMRQPEAVKWLYDHIMEFIQVVPEKVLSNGTFGKICRSLVGVIAFKISHLPKDISQARMDREIFECVQAGFHFGRSYLFDDLLDLDTAPEEKKRLLTSTLNLLQGLPIVDPPRDRASELVIESLQAFRTMYGEQHARCIYNAYLALAMAEIHEGKKSYDGVYAERDLYAPMMVKSAYTRIIPALLGRFPITTNFLSHAYLTSLHHQMLDDFKDLKEDLEDNTFTPYTYFVRNRGKNPNFRHPLPVYLHAIDLIVRKLGDDPEIRRLWISRMILGLRVFEFKGGPGALGRFFADHPTGEKDLEGQLLRAAGVSEVVLDPESILASLASTSSMYVRGMTAKPLITH